MRQLLALLVASFFSSSLLACGTDAPPPGTGFVPVPDERGYAWAWQEDRSLRVVLYTGDVPGLLVERGERALGSWTDWGTGPQFLPIVLAAPRSDGTPPLAADASPGLHLLLAGSAEHGCPADDLEVDVQPRRDGDEVVVELSINGIVYFALPTDGVVIVSSAEGQTLIDAETVCQQQASQEFADFQWLRSEGTELGPLELTAHSPVPWFQVQGHSGLLEVDYDHSCEAAEPIREAELRLVARL